MQSLKVAVDTDIDDGDTFGTLVNWGTMTYFTYSSQYPSTDSGDFNMYLNFYNHNNVNLVQSDVSILPTLPSLPSIPSAFPSPPLYPPSANV